MKKIIIGLFLIFGCVGCDSHYGNKLMVTKIKSCQVNQIAETHWSLVENRNAPALCKHIAEVMNESRMNISFHYWCK